LGGSGSETVGTRSELREKERARERERERARERERDREIIPEVHPFSGVC
jgi:hypothetical protein